MFSTQTEDERIYALKPMNLPWLGIDVCSRLEKLPRPAVKNGGIWQVHRYEPSGALHGLMRVRHFTQDDAHIYCTDEQMEQECISVVELILEIYRDFGFEDVVIKLSTRPEKRIGSDEVWDKLEGALNRSAWRYGSGLCAVSRRGRFLWT